MIDYVYVVKRNGKFLADRFYRFDWSVTLIRAKTFLTEAEANVAAENWNGTVVLVQLKEIENED